ncbi:MAG: sterol desaturase/sphingolipid hydroxylase (fatty acid hydroxylase superfamily) [Litorivivens sp.]|jgi:sterol desaturase/sphingolipid hydroxylase (fatty acid hydroxylase superfamily)
MLDIIAKAYTEYGSYLWGQITLMNDGGLWRNYFWLLVLISIFFFSLELAKPWRVNQPKFRKDFWLDFFYMFFNFFFFSLIIYNASSEVVVNLFNKGISGLTGVNLQSLNPMNSWPLWAILAIGFLVRDFVQWWVHRLLHKVPRLWEFHKVHHSVEEMGFAAHLRYHWMETLVYRTLEYIPLALIGIGLHDFFLIHIFTLAWGHYNHANFSVSSRLTGGLVLSLITLFVVTTEHSLSVPVILGITAAGFLVGAIALGPLMKKIFNSPEMHIWHHAYDLPKSHPNGINFGLTLAIWDYIFGTAVVPNDGRDIKLGFQGIDKFPRTFLQQMTFGFFKRKK